MLNTRGFTVLSGGGILNVEKILNEEKMQISEAETTPQVSR